VGILQFDVVAHRLKAEYNVEAIFENISIATARWVSCDDERKLDEFRRKGGSNVGQDAHGDLVYLAPTRVNLQLTEERWPDLTFRATREQPISTD